MRLRLTIFNKGLILTVALFLFQLGFIAHLALIQQSDADASQWSMHTKTVLGQAHAALIKLLELEAGIRGLVLTGNSEFSQPFHAIAKELPSDLEAMQNLVADNAAQVQRAKRICAKSRQVIDWHVESYRLVKEGTPSLAATRASSLQGKKLMDDVRQEIEAFVETEKQLESERDDAMNQARRVFQWSLMAGSMVTLFMVLTLGWAFSRGISGRLSTLSLNTQRLADGKKLLPILKGDDEIAMVDKAFHSMEEKLGASQRALREQARTLKSILDNMGDGVIVADADGNFTRWNPAAERIMGIGSTDTLPSEWTATYGVFLPDKETPFPVDDLPLVRAIRGKACDQVEQFVRNQIFPQGVWITVTGRPLLNEDGQPNGGVVVVRDSTESKRAEDSIRRLNNELEQRVLERTAALSEANRELALKNQENEMFVYSVSHDLRSPLVNLEGFSKELSLVCQEVRAILVDNELPARVRGRGLHLVDDEMAESIRFIQTGVLRLSKIIDALLRLSRVGRVEFQWKEVEVRPLCARVITAMSSTISARKAEVRLGELPTAWGDPTALEQIFANLIGNALNYLDSKRPGVIEIGALDSTDAKSIYFVKDNGLGISDAYKSKVFKAFQRLHPGVAPGEGMGLTVVHRLVERVRGKIWFESAAGAGTTFFVSLPAYSGPVSSGPAVPSRQTQLDLSGGIRHGN